jgi:nitrate reductase gamma subunit
MAVEILFLKSLWEHNRKLWKRSFFFHFGLYLLVLTIGLLIFSASLTIWFPSGLAGSIGNFIEFLYEIAGAVGLAFSILGAIGLLVRRLSDPELKEYTTGADIFNLVFFIVTFALIAAGVILRAPSDPSVFAIFKGLLRFDTEVEVPGLLAAGLLLGSILTAYIPMTHMSHFIAKYFTYHSVRWDDSVNRKGGKLEAGIAKNLSYKPTWAAGHVRADGKRTWAEIAAINPAAEEKK